MNHFSKILTREPLEIDESLVPVDWPRRIGYPPPGIIRLNAYPAGQKNIDSEFPATALGQKLAQTQAWLLPSKRVKAGKNIYRY